MQYQSSGHLNQIDGKLQLTAQGRLIADRLVREALG
jgi:oxygen-independent coproporphyrinogen-3 oxidase